MKAGFVGLIGLPNAGKSTFLNWFVNEKLSIVTPKPQTTRRRIIGLVNSPEGQIVFVDAPGLVEKTEGLFQYLKKEAEAVAESSDALICFLNLDEEKKENLENLLKWINEFRKPYIVVVTKTDIERTVHRLPAMMDLINATGKPKKVFQLSHKKWTEEDKKEIVESCLSLLPESPAPLYDPDLYTPHSVKEIASEIIRESCMEEIHKEIPFQMAVRINQFDDSSPKMHKIYAELLVTKENHKPIVIGQGGVKIKAIGTSARQKLEKLFGVKIFLDLKVVVRENWDQNTRLMKELGYFHDNE